MKIVIITQEDAYYIPRLIARLMPQRRGDIAAITIVPGEMEARNVRKYWDFLGPLDFLRYTARYGAYRVLDVVLPRGLDARFYSVRAVARRFRIPVVETANVNAPEYLERLRGMGVDLVVSVAAPQIFKAELLRTPRYGCINVHNSLLPAFPGMNAVEDALKYGVRVTGVTVHFVDEGVDSGPIILQEPLELSYPPDMAETEERVHGVEHELLPRAIRLIARGSVRIDPSDPRHVLIEDGDD